jgi:hypothetical protein
MVDASTVAAQPPLLLELAITHQCTTRSDTSNTALLARSLSQQAGVAAGLGPAHLLPVAASEVAQHNSCQAESPTSPTRPMQQPATTGLFPLPAPGSLGQKTNRLALLPSKGPGAGSRHKRPISRFAASATCPTPTPQGQQLHTATASSAGAIRAKATTTFLANAQAAADDAVGALNALLPARAVAAGRAAALQAIDTGVAQLCRADQEELLLVRWARGVGRAEGRQQPESRLAASAADAPIRAACN